MFLISKSDFINLCKSMGKDPEFEKLRAEVLSILKKQAKAESNGKDIHKSLEEMDKSFKYFDKDEFIIKSGYPVGTVREWKGKKYIKVAPNKWKPKYDSESRGAKNSITRLMKQVENCKNVEELMNLVMENKQRFTDANGNHLPIVDKLRAVADKKNDSLSSGKNSNVRSKKDIHDVTVDDYSFQKVGGKWLVRDENGGLFLGEKFKSKKDAIEWARRNILKREFYQDRYEAKQAEKMKEESDGVKKESPKAEENNTSDSSIKNSLETYINSTKYYKDKKLTISVEHGFVTGKIDGKDIEGGFRYKPGAKDGHGDDWNEGALGNLVVRARQQGLLDEKKKSPKAEESDDRKASREKLKKMNQEWETVIPEMKKMIKKYGVVEIPLAQTLFEKHRDFYEKVMNIFNRDAHYFNYYTGKLAIQMAREREKEKTTKGEESEAEKHANISEEKKEKMKANLEKLDKLSKEGKTEFNDREFNDIKNENQKIYETLSDSDKNKMLEYLADMRANKEKQKKIEDLIENAINQIVYDEKKISSMSDKKLETEIEKLKNTYGKERTESQVREDLKPILSNNAYDDPVAAYGSFVGRDIANRRNLKQLESELEKRKNRSDAMKGNQNAYKGALANKDKVHFVNSLKGEPYDTYMTNKDVFAVYFDKDTGKETGIAMTKEIAVIIDSHNEPSVLDWKDNIATDIRAKYPNIDRSYITANIGAIRMGYRNGKKQNIFIINDNTEDSMKDESKTSSKDIKSMSDDELETEHKKVVKDIDDITKENESIYDKNSGWNRGLSSEDEKPDSDYQKWLKNGQKLRELKTKENDLFFERKNRTNKDTKEPESNWIKNGNDIPDEKATTTWKRDRKRKQKDVENFLGVKKGLFEEDEETDIAETVRSVLSEII